MGRARSGKRPGGGARQAADDRQGTVEVEQVVVRKLLAVELLGRHQVDASLAGFSGSLGDIIANETSYHFSGVLGAAICVAALALAIDAVLALVQRALTPRGLRLLGGERHASARPGRAVAGPRPIPS